jgi:hypothetical protein
VERKPDAKSLRLAAKGLYFSPGQVRSRLHSMIRSVLRVSVHPQIAISSVLLCSPLLKASLPLMSCPATLRVHRCARHWAAGQEYFHCRTGVVIRRDEADLVDSDDDVDTTWIQKQNEDLMDEFTDVSQDEKTFMKLWNDFMQVCPRG